MNNCDKCGGTVLIDDSPVLDSYMESSCIMCGTLKFYSIKDIPEAKHWHTQRLRRATGLR